MEITGVPLFGVVIIRATTRVLLACDAGSNRRFDCFFLEEFLYYIFDFFFFGGVKAAKLKVYLFLALAVRVLHVEFIR